MPTELTVELRQETPQMSAVTEVTTKPETVSEVLGGALGRLYQRLEADDVAPVGPPFAIYRNADTGGWHVTVGVPVERALVYSEGVRPMLYAPGTVAVCVHAGSYEGIGATWSGMEAWVREHGLEPSSPPFERYVVAPAQSKDPSAWRTEICWPITPPQL